MEVSSVPLGESCSAFARIAGDPPPGVARFVIGEDPAPRLMTAQEQAAELGDPFATLVLQRGVFPTTSVGAIEALRSAVPAGDPLAQLQTFVLGEGSQIARTTETEGVVRSVRFVAATGSVGTVGPDVMISTFHPDAADVELMAWDRVRGGFNFYRTIGASGAWVWAGNSRHAMGAATEGKGVFQAHPTGAFLMKEFKLPWVHWHSGQAQFGAAVFDADDARGVHPWFVNRGKAEICELNVAAPSIQRVVDLHIAAAVEGNAVARPQRLARHILETQTANLFSSHQTELGASAPGAIVDLPPTFFVDADALRLAPIGLPGPSIRVDAEQYRAALAAVNARLEDGGGFSQPGDTHFLFVVPERAVEDVQTVDAAMAAGIFTPRLTATLLMTDFPNPVFSARRASLLRHVPQTGTTGDGPDGLSERIAAAILAAAEASPPGSAEREFAGRWAAGESWRAAYAAELATYFAALQARADTPEGVLDFVRLAASRRIQAEAALPIVEFKLLFATTDVTDTLEMRADATVTQIPGGA